MFKFFTPKKVMAISSTVATSVFAYNEWRNGPNTEEIKQQAEQRAANAGKTEVFYGATGYSFPIAKQNADVPAAPAPTMKFGSGSNE